MQRASPISIAEWTIHCYTLSSWVKKQPNKKKENTLFGKIQPMKEHFTSEISLMGATDKRAFSNEYTLLLSEGH